MVLTVVSSWFLLFGVPATVFVVLYSFVIHALRQRNSATLGHSNVIEQTTKRVTKSAIAISVIFIISYGFLANGFLASGLKLLAPAVDLIMYSIGTLLTNFNSTVNPFVYALTLPVFRRGMHQTFCCIKCNKEKQDDKRAHHQHTSQPDIAVIV